MKIWIFLPAYNEEESLRRLLPKFRDVRKHLPGYEAVVLVVDDGSSDGTARIARDAAGDLPVEVLVHPINRGLGETAVPLNVRDAEHAKMLSLVLPAAATQATAAAPSSATQLKAEIARLTEGCKAVKP